jgi:hypothetical protein
VVVVLAQQQMERLERLERLTEAAVQVVRQVALIHRQAKAAQASSSFPMLAHNNLVAVSSLLLVATPFTHLQLLALLFQSHLCLHPI